MGLVLLVTLSDGGRPQPDGDLLVNAVDGVPRVAPPEHGTQPPTRSHEPDGNAIPVQGSR